MLQLEQRAAAVQEPLAVQHHSRFGVWKDIAQVLWRNPKSRVGLVIFAIFVLVALTGSLFAPYSVNASDFAPMSHPSWQHWLGTTQGGQDVLSQLIVGTRSSIMTAFGVGLIATILSVLVGLASGYASGWPDDVLSFITNVFLVLPGLPLLIVLASYAPGKGAGLIILIVGLTSWPWGARVLRSQAATLRARDFVVAARLAGDSTPRILLREILVNMQSLVAANFLGASLYGLLTAIGLEFLGLGNPSDVSWGSMLYWAQNGGALLLGQWAWILAPGVCIAVFGMSMVLINFGLDELSNPRLRSSDA
jgi:peptide/nickel transport system permease protein